MFLVHGAMLVSPSVRECRRVEAYVGRLWWGSIDSNVSKLVIGSFSEMNHSHWLIHGYYQQLYNPDGSGCRIYYVGTICYIKAQFNIQTFTIRRNQIIFCLCCYILSEFLKGFFGTIRDGKDCHLAIIQNKYLDRPSINHPQEMILIQCSSGQ